MRSLPSLSLSLALPLALSLAPGCKKKEPTPPAKTMTDAPATAPAPVAPAAAPAPAAGYKPRYAQRMFEVALRFHLAGKAVDKNNWDYATHQAYELVETFKNDLPYVLPAANVPPGVDLKGLRAQFTSGPATALLDAAKKRDRKLWDAAYANAAQSCNACHAQVGKGFITIKAKAGNTFEDLIGLEGAK